MDRSLFLSHNWWNGIFFEPICWPDSSSKPLASLEGIDGSICSSEALASLEAIDGPISSSQPLASLETIVETLSSSKQFVDLALFLSLSLRSSQLVDRSSLDSPSLRSRQFLDYSSFLFWPQMTGSKFKNLLILTSNDPRRPQFGVRWPQMTSKTTLC